VSRQSRRSVEFIGTIPFAKSGSTTLIAFHDPPIIPWPIGTVISAENVARRNSAQAAAGSTSVPGGQALEVFDQPAAGSRCVVEIARGESAVDLQPVWAPRRRA
jgi:hypothetical protein